MGIASGTGRGSDVCPPLPLLVARFVGDAPLPPVFPPLFNPKGTLAPWLGGRPFPFALPLAWRTFGPEAASANLCLLFGTEYEEAAGRTVPALAPGTYPCVELTGVVARGGTDPARAGFRLFS
jgi:hypothetical protein